MTPASQYPAPLPLSREHALEIVSDLDGRAAIPGAFLTFVMIPVEARIGEWRFAGASGSLAEALRRVGEFMLTMGTDEPVARSALAAWLQEDALTAWTKLRDAWSYKDLPLDEIGEHRVVLFLEGQAPYDDCGACVLELDDLGPWAERAPQTEWPETWDEREEE